MLNYFTKIVESLPTYNVSTKKGITRETSRFQIAIYVKKIIGQWAFCVWGGEGTKFGFE